MDILARYQPQALSAMRIVAALLFLDEGSSKVFGWPHNPAFDHLVLGSWPEGIAGPLEVIFGTFILLGLFSRIFAFLASGEMAIAYFVGHMIPKESIHPFINGGSLAALYCFVFLYIACAGPGPWAINQK